MTWKREENNMDNDLKELLISVANNLENIAYYSDNSRVDGYLRIIAQDIYAYLDTVEDN